MRFDHGAIRVAITSTDLGEEVVGHCSI
jgi:hypothetical protein